MGRYSSKLPSTGASETKLRSWTDQQWCSIEKAVGRSLTDHERRLLRSITEKYLQNLDQEGWATNVEVARERLTEIQNSAERLAGVLRTPKKSDEGRKADKISSARDQEQAEHYIRWRLKSSLSRASLLSLYEGPSHEAQEAAGIEIACDNRKIRPLSLDGIGRLMGELAGCCNDAMRELDKDTDSRFFIRGDAWKQWVFDLCSFWEELGPRFTASVAKSPDRIRSPSPFARFVNEIQLTFDKHQRFSCTGSEPGRAGPALQEAIYPVVREWKARRRSA
jgi:hypothetical protein